MIFIDLNKVEGLDEWIKEAKRLTTELEGKPENQRMDFIEKNREKTWGHPELIKALRKVVDNKCWYSEVSLEGADPNVDHFRPKGFIRDVACGNSFDVLKSTASGYWWWAFELHNFRLSSMHANQRRVDEHTDGGKWDFFPVVGNRAAEKTLYSAALEDFLALDPCSPSDVRLLWFDPDGKARCSDPISKKTEHDKLRVRFSVWLYHLDKREIEQQRAKYMGEIRSKLDTANSFYLIWSSDPRNLTAKKSFDDKIADIKRLIADDKVFAGAKRCAVRAAMSEYDWISEFNLI